MQEKSLIKSNILKYLEYKDITKYKFYQVTGITRGVLDQNNGMSEENTARFIAHYPEVSVEWLITGRGEMLKSEGRALEDANSASTCVKGDDEYLKRYIQKLEYENEKKQELIDGFLSGAIVVDKKEPPDTSVSYQSTG